VTTKNVIDGQSFAPQLLGKKGKQREWIFIQLANKWYVRSANWKLNEAGELFDMSKSPFDEHLVTANTKDARAIAARQKLQRVLAKLNPAGGILDDGDGTGRHKSKATKKSQEKPKN
jgi:arylsulfatase A